MINWLLINDNAQVSIEKDIRDKNRHIIVSVKKGLLNQALYYVSTSPSVLTRDLSSLSLVLFLRIINVTNV